MRMRVLWFPFHPTGYVIGISSGIIDVYWFTLFICWLSKLLILRHSRVRSYRKALPFFMGLVSGDFIVGCGDCLVLFMTWF